MSNSIERPDDDFSDLYGKFKENCYKDTNDVKRLEDIKDSLQSAAPFSGDAAMAVLLPVSHQEEGLHHLYKEYGKQYALSGDRKIEVLTLIAAPEGAPEEVVTGSPPYLASRRFMERLNDKQGKKPPVNFTLASGGYPPEYGKESRIRNDLVSIVADKLIEVGHPNPGEIILVNHRANIRKLSPSYFKAIDKLNSDSSINPVFAGNVDFSEADMYAHHMLYALRRFQDEFEGGFPFTMNWPTLKEGNLSYRLNDFLREASRPETIDPGKALIDFVRNGTRSKLSRVLAGSDADVVVNARHHKDALTSGKAYAEADNILHDVFRLSVPLPSLNSVRTAVKATSVNFPLELEKQLQLLYEYYSMHVDNVTNGLNKGVLLGIIKSCFRHSGLIIGVDLEISDSGKVKIHSFEGMKRKLLRDFNNN